MSEPCTCPVAQYCERWKRKMPAHLWNLCQTRTDYRQLWDRVGLHPDPPALGVGPAAIPYNPDFYYGPGTELAKLIKGYGFSYSQSCGCEQIAKMMNENGVQWCRDNADLIIGHMVAESSKRGWFNLLVKLSPTFVEAGARKLLMKALEISEAKEGKGEKTQTQGEFMPR